MTTQRQNTEVRGPDGFTPSQLRKLKIAVVVMGVILIAGFAGLIWRIVYLINKGERTSAVSAIAKEARLPLPPGATVRNLALSGDRLAVHYDAPSGSGIALLDLVTGQPLARVDLVPQVPRQ
jgi:hypothetical protein